jgi:hypothetical protein
MNLPIPFFIHVMHTSVHAFWWSSISTELALWIMLPNAIIFKAGNVRERKSLPLRGGQVCLVQIGFGVLAGHF